MSFTFIEETKIVLKETKILKFKDARRLIKWTPKGVNYKPQYISDMSVEHIESIVNMLKKFSNTALENTYCGLRNREWLRLFKSELEFREAVVKVQKRSCKLNRAVAALDAIRNR